MVMAPRKKRFYAVVRGHYSPAIFTSWAVACAFTDGYKGNKHKGFKSLEDAKSYMEENNIIEYHVFGNPGELNPKMAKGERYYFAVANSREIRIYECYCNETKERVDQYPHSCHKRFDTLDEAQAFIADYKAAKRCMNQQKNSGDDVLEGVMRRLRLDGTEPVI